MHLGRAGPVRATTTATTTVIMNHDTPAPSNAAQSPCQNQPLQLSPALAPLSPRDHCNHWRNPIHDATTTTGATTTTTTFTTHRDHVVDVVGIGGVEEEDEEEEEEEQREEEDYHHDDHDDGNDDDGLGDD